MMIRVKNGVAKFINGGKVVPVEHLAHQKMPEDGFYTASEATCGGNCSVGEPDMYCKRNNIYSEKRCAVYFLRPIE